jgi:AraC family transcriptional regulator
VTPHPKDDRVSIKKAGVVMQTRRLILSETGKFEVSCNRTLPAFYPLEAREMVRILIPMESALYSVTSPSVDGKSVIHQLGARDILVIPSGQCHGVTWRRDADMISFQMSESFMQRATGLIHLKIEDSLTLRDPLVSSAAAELRALVIGDQLPGSAFVDAIATLVAYRVGLHAAAGHRMRPERIEQALSECQVGLINSYVDQHMDSPISLRSLAKVLNMSTWHFVRRFTVSQGVPPHAYIKQRRLSRAKNLLLESDISILGVAMEIGMSHSHFSRSFLSYFGASPREFRRIQRA